MNRPTTKRRILLEMAEGRTAGAILENGFLDMCLDRGVGVHMLTPGARFEPFIERYQQPGVQFTYLPTENALSLAGASKLEARLGIRLLRAGLPKLRRLLWSTVGERAAAGRAGFIGDLVRKERPDAVVASSVTIGFDQGMISTAKRLGIPSLGNVFSWDHPFRIQRSRPDRLTCWSQVVKDWLTELAGFEPEVIEVIGAPAFDAYFDGGGVLSREELCDQIGFDPERPILMFPTLGQMRQMIDETGPFRALMRAIDDGDIPGRPQVILRLHPLSVEYYFEDYRGRDDAYFSRFSGYCPGMRWWPSRDDVVLAGNLMRHADVCVSPGSTMAVEPAIFDTPTIVPTFNQYTTEEFAAFFKMHWMEKHFRYLAENDLLQFADSAEAMVEMTNRCLADRTWMAEARSSIRDTLLGPMDGRATERLADVAVEMAGA
jgi:hypothetical protein